ncbi:MAG: hypothetical protein ACKN9J_00615 [Holophagaceae bacterium]
MPKLLKDVIQVAPRFKRSIRIDTDIHDSKVLDGFICPPSFMSLLETLVAHAASSVEDQRKYSFTWTGPYGGGKSSLMAVLGALLKADPLSKSKLKEIFRSKPEFIKSFYQSFPPGTKGWRILPINGNRDPIIDIMREALEREKLCKKTIPRTISRDWLTKTIEEIALDQPTQYGGLAIFIDELGKVLEGAASTRGDIGFLQDLAEIADRSKGRLLVIGVLHQSFAEYANVLTQDARNEFNKIQGRFIDMLVNVSGEEQLDLISKAITHAKPLNIKDPESIDVIANQLSDKEGKTTKFLTQTLKNTYPLHPVVAGMLGPISRRRFGQNQRSIFGFLNSAEPLGFQSFIESHEVGEVYRPEQYFDYLRVNLEPTIAASSDGHRWAMATQHVDACESRTGDSGLLPSLMKTIALIDLFRGGSRMLATPRVIEVAFSHYPSQEVKRSIKKLIDQKSIRLRKHISNEGTYSIFEGSDFDIDEALAVARHQIKEIDLMSLSAVCSLAPIVGKEHYHTTGCIRWMSLELMPVATLKPEQFAENLFNASLFGKFILLIPTKGESKSDIRKVMDLFESNYKDPRHPVVLGSCHDDDYHQLTEVAHECLALQHIRRDRPELSGDQIARNEVDTNIALRERQLEQIVQSLLDSAKWTTFGQKPKNLEQQGGSLNLKERTNLVSVLANHCFSKSLRIRNELLHRDSVSSQAMSGLKKLIEAMFSKQGEKRLGIKGYPIEGGMFESVLSESYLYEDNQFRHPGKDGISLEAKKDLSNIGPLFDAIDHFFKNNKNRNVDLSEIEDILRSRPYGVKKGLLWIILSAYLIIHKSELSFYAEHRYSTEGADEFWVSCLINHPWKDMQVRSIQLSDEIQETLIKISQTIDDSPSCSNGAPIDVLKLARAFVSQWFYLPNWTKRSQSNLTDGAKLLRQKLESAKDPYELLINDFSELKTYASDNKIKFEVFLSSALLELKTLFPKKLNDFKVQLLKDLQCESNIEDYVSLNKRAENLIKLSNDPQMNGFIRILTGFRGEVLNSEASVERICGMIIGKPSSDWTDDDVREIPLRIRHFAREFVNYESLAPLAGREENRERISIICEEDREIRVRNVTINSSDRVLAKIRAKKLIELTKEWPDQSRDSILGALTEASKIIIDGDIDG